MQKITPFLWFDNQAEEAMDFYVSLFKNSRVVEATPFPENTPIPGVDDTTGMVMNGIFELEGYQFMAIDAGPVFKFNPSISFFVNYEDEAQLDELWEKLSEGGNVLMPYQKYDFSEKYGWLTDKYGVSWQLTKNKHSQTIIPSLLFVNQQWGKAEDAMKFYTSVFPDSKVGEIYRYGTDAGKDEGKVMYAEFTLHGQTFTAMDSGLEHDYNFNEAVSFYVDCQDQAEVDELWEKLSAVPESEQCGWLKDKFGVSWQIVPKQLGELMSDPDKKKAAAVMQAMLKMHKIEVDKLQQAYNAA